LQLHVRADEQVPGHGVGLAVVSDLVASHEGELNLSRSDQGERESISFCRPLDRLCIGSGSVHGWPRKMRSMPTQGASVKPSISTKFVAAAALALGAASAVHARSDVYISVGVQGAPIYVAPAPVYVQPQPVYVPQRPVYVQQPVYYPAPVYQPAHSRHWRGHDDRDDRAYQDDGRRHRHGRVFYDADGDGIPNGRDSFDDRVFHRHDVDGDGIPNWKDSRDNRGQPIWWREGYHPSRDEAYGTPYRRRH